MSGSRTPVTVDPDTGLKIFDARAAKASKRIAGDHLEISNSAGAVEAGQAASKGHLSQLASQVVAPAPFEGEN